MPGQPALTTLILWLHVLDRGARRGEREELRYEGGVDSFFNGTTEGLPASGTFGRFEPQLRKRDCVVEGSVAEFDIVARLTAKEVAEPVALLAIAGLYQSVDDGLPPA